MFFDPLQKPIEYLKKLNQKKANLFKTELNIYTYEDLLFFYPKGYIHLLTLKNISELSNNNNNNFVRILGKITNIEEIKNKKRKILVARLEDQTGFIELVWFKKIHFFKNVKKNILIIVYGKVKYFRQKIQIIHPIIHTHTNIKKFQSSKKIFSIYPIYSIPNNLKKKGINNLLMINLLKNIIEEIKNDIKEFFFEDFLEKKLMSRKKSLIQIHFPESLDYLLQAQYSLKFEELFLLQLFLLSKRKNAKSNQFSKLGKNFHNFYKNYLPFTLTEEQKKVFKEIWNDLKKPIQMNRLLQGEVGCGKTIIAILSMLIASDNGFQSCLMAPTEVLAIQHYYSIKKMFSEIGIKIALLTSSTSNSERKYLYHEIFMGTISIVIGTHTLIQDKVRFKNLGLAIIDEEQRFGVIQRTKVWKKNNKYPHILIMTATPIPRTLAKIIYHDLNISIIRESPLGRKPVKTIHFWNKNRDQAFDIVKNQILKGRQIYIVYPTINTSYKNRNISLMKGYKEIKEKFKDLKIGILHGAMNCKEKNLQMNQFICGKTQILITTTVIEVGVDVPNATVILIENADCFGLSQLHQLRGRVGRGIYQSYCILITTNNKKMNTEGYQRIKKMSETNEGLRIAKEDLKLRGSGDLIGTKQSGKSYFRMVNLIKDYKLVRDVFPVVKNFFIKNPNFFKNRKDIFYKYLNLNKKSNK
ncbi:ATP-dependent DNA helicase RecG [Blattabacterium cuenoti]|uniref:ATP-dependent DNA helicase RecG n=1 Tax=Blattabacterium cuenoti TaxID=1653831 RepID=UPI00163CD224|nr:ATP-dependent DNA helicase RecG [Blattabacterium cuenoti]